MCDTQQSKHPRLSAILWVILLGTISLQVMGTASHHHSVADHYQQRTHELRLHQQRQSLDVPSRPPKPQNEAQQQTSNKSSKLWLINSNPDQYHPQSNNGWAFRGWHNHLVTTQTTTTTTTTTTPRTTVARTPYPSLWNYAPKKGSTHSRQNTTTRELNPKHG